MVGDLTMKSSAPRFGHERGLYALACDEEASLHYHIQHEGLLGGLWRLRCYLLGFFGR